MYVNLLCKLFCSKCSRSVKKHRPRWRRDFLCCGWQVQDLEQSNTISPSLQTSIIYFFFFTFSEKLILTGAWDGTVKLWGLKSPAGIGSTPLAEFYDHENPIQSVSLSSSGKYSAAGADDGRVVIWDSKLRTEIVSYQVSPSAKYTEYLNCHVFSWYEKVLDISFFPLDLIGPSAGSSGFLRHLVHPFILSEDSPRTSSSAVRWTV